MPFQITYLTNRFQSTLPRRERLASSYAKVALSSISIHAPAKGATQLPFHQLLLDYYFNPRSREGSDRTAIFYFKMFHVFQSTLPRRERQLIGNLDYTILNFNPRSREGSDFIDILLCRATHISIHAPAKGATTLGNIFLTHIIISIHAPAKGATPIKCRAKRIQSIFQSTLPRRERQDCSMGEFNSVAISIHAPAKGATNNLC